ncbi:MAG: AIR synthase related protein, partial [Proteobacteria bacterium]|nr:AIR synthase related protein [Pseudomonadota bacterium]
VTSSGRLGASYKGILEIDLDVAPLTDEAPVYNRPIGPRLDSPSSSLALMALSKKLVDPSFAADMFLKALRDKGSNEPIYSQFDQHIGTKTVFGPDSGGAGVLWIRSLETESNPWLGIALAAGCNERRVKNNPFWGAADAVLGCVKSIVSAGGLPLAVTDCLNFGSPEDPAVMREFSDSVDGISFACRALEIPIISGNVSLYNSTDGVSIYPTPMIGVVGKVKDVRQATPAIVKQSANLWFIGPKSASPTLAASLVAKLMDVDPTVGKINEILWEQEKSAFLVLERWREEGLLVPFFEELQASYLIEFSRDAKEIYASLKALADSKDLVIVQVLSSDNFVSASGQGKLKLPFGSFNMVDLESTWNSSHAM